MSMMFERPRQKKGVYERGEVACEKCGKAIYIYNLKKLPKEFSLHCSHCGHRGIYQQPALKIQDMPERRKKTRKEPQK
jgi:DNA-directed RNA polymerase subunit RPC12/RpoP